MKDINKYIMESSSSTIVNRIKKEFEKEFGNTVTIGSGRANYRQLYDVYIYDDKFETLQKVNEILKKHIPIWKGFTDDEMKNKLKEKEEFFKKHKDDKWVTLDRYPINQYINESIKYCINIEQIKNECPNFYAAASQFCRDKN